MERSFLVSVVMVTNSLLHILWCHLLINVSGLGVVGASLATLISFTLNFLMITLFCLSMTDLRESFFFFTSETCHDLGEYLKIGFPSAIMLCLEWGGLESLIIIAGFISVNASAVQVIALNSFLVIMMIPIGF